MDRKNEAVEAIRSCDGCFNRFVFFCELRQKDLNIMDKALRKASVKPNAGREDSSGIGPNTESSTSALKNTLFSWSGGSPNKSPGKESEGNSPASGIRALQAQNAETMQALQERGERLEQLNDKAAKMNDAASDFQESTQRLLQQQRSKQWF